MGGPGRGEARVRGACRTAVQGAVLTCAALLASACLLNTGDISLIPFGGGQALTEQVIYGKKNKGEKLALVEVQGVISEESPLDPLSRSSVNMVARVREALDLAREDDEVRGVLLRIYSPGGTVTASETIYHELQRFKQETGRPVVAYMQGLAASGGYYVAMAADEILAHPAAITGSIGVILSGFNIAGLMERFGVADQTLTTGPYKDTGSPFRRMRPDEREQMQELLGQLFEGFRQVVVAGRPQLGEAKIRELADGRIFSARQAAELGLIDAVGHFEDAIAALEKRAGVSNTRVVLYQRPESYRTNAYSRAGDGPPRVEVDVDWIDLGRLLPPAGFYYLWPPALGDLARR